MAQNDNPDGNGTAHTIFRVIQVLTLIPAWAVLAAVIDHYNRNNAQTPGSIIFLFVVTLLASVWSFCVLITFLRARNTALWMTFFDIVAMALLIAAVVVLSNIANVDCVAVRVNEVQYNLTGVNSNQAWWNTRRLAKRDETDGPYTYRQHCGEIKAAWGLAIANIIFFFITAILAALIYRENQEPPVVREKFIVEQPSVYSQPAVATPPPVFQEPYYGPAPPRRHSRDHRSHRSHSHRSSHPSYNGGSYYEGSRRGSRGPDYYV